MRKLYFLLLICCASLGAQNAAIADANLLSKLLQADIDNDIAGNLKIDANNDGNIQLTEAAAISVLSVPQSQIASIAGLEAFSNLSSLKIYSNQLTTLDLRPFINLEYINCGANGSLQQINLTGLTGLKTFIGVDVAATTLDLSTLTGLVEVNISDNSLLAEVVFGNHPNLIDLKSTNNPMLAQLAVGNLTALKYLWCYTSNLSSLDVAQLVNLKELRCQSNQLTALAVGNLVALESLECASNQIAALDLNQLSQLRKLDVGANNLSQLDLSGNMQLEYLSLGANAFTTIDLDPVSNLVFLSVNNAQLTDLDLVALTQLERLELSNLSLANLDLSHNNLIIFFGLQQSAVTAVDLSQVSVPIFEVQIRQNPNIEFINVKNGLGVTFLSVRECPSLLHLCKDDITVAGVSLSGNPQISSYCTFVPGGSYNTISGTARLDYNNNGCTSDEPIAHNLKVAINDGTSNGATFIGNAGNYTFHVQRPNLTLTPSVENYAYFNVTPSSVNVNFPSNNQSTQQVDFCLTPNGVHYDFEVIITPVGRLRPGFDQTYDIIFRNKGNQNISGELVFEFDDLSMDFISASQMPASQSFGNLRWNYTDLQPFVSRSIRVVLNVNGPMENPAVNIGDTFECSATITAFANDEMPEDNTFTLPEVVVGAYDPNEKICLQGTTVSPEQIGKYLHYRINFENIGTAEAQNIVVRDQIDTAKYDVSSLQVLDVSHPVYTRIANGKVEFIFEDINLAAAAHGHVVFKIKTKSTLAVGSSVSNRADIFFDYNFPVVTDPAVTVFSILGREDFKTDESVAIMPNPATDMLTVQANAAIRSIDLFDLQGRLLITKLPYALQTRLDVSGYPKGVYLVKVATANGNAAREIIKN